MRTRGQQRPGPRAPGLPGRAAARTEDHPGARRAVLAPPPGARLAHSLDPETSRRGPSRHRPLPSPHLGPEWSIVAAPPIRVHQPEMRLFIGGKEGLRTQPMGPWTWPQTPPWAPGLLGCPAHGSCALGPSPGLEPARAAPGGGRGRGGLGRGQRGSRLHGAPGVGLAASRPAHPSCPGHSGGSDPSPLRLCPSHPRLMEDKGGTHETGSLLRVWGGTGTQASWPPPLTPHAEAQAFQSR